EAAAPCLGRTLRRGRHSTAPERGSPQLGGKSRGLFVDRHSWESGLYLEVRNAGPKSLTPPRSLFRGVVFLEFGLEPGAGVSPVPKGGSARDTQGQRRLVDGEPRKNAEFGDLGGRGIFLGKTPQGVVQEQPALGIVGGSLVDVRDS